MEVKALCDAAVAAILRGTRITLTRPKGAAWPKGFPRGQLLSVGAKGENRSFDPVTVLAHVRDHVRSLRGIPNVQGVATAEGGSPPAQS